MAIVGFNFTKISAQKTGSVTGKVNVNNNIAVTEVKEINVSMGDTKNKGLVIKFDYSCSYEPKVGTIQFMGDLLAMEKPEKVAEIVKEWTESKKLEKTILQAAMAYVLNKCTIQAILMSKEISLPAPIPLPKIDMAKAAASSAAAPEKQDKTEKPAVKKK